MTRTLAARLFSVLALGSASVASAYTYTDENGVRYSCHDEQVTTTTQTDDHSTAGTVIGGALGGLAGNQFGKGSGKAAATAAGAVGGALIGRNQGKAKTRQSTTNQRRCTRLN
jgi:uncharacterized protein YcfJ